MTSLAAQLRLALLTCVLAAAGCTDPSEPGGPDGPPANPYTGRWSNLSFTTTAGTYHLHAFTIDADGNFGAGPDDSVRGYTAVGAVDLGGALSGELSWRASTSGGVTTKPFAGHCVTTASCMATITEGRLVLTQ